MKYKYQYTPRQEQVIDLRSCNLLVSAAAGSGKTAVLTQRIINRICDADSKVSIDKILIVTFTKAAASEMRERIGVALHEVLRENPSDAHISKQITLLNSAQITTIDSFCLYLLRNHFHDIHLDPAFKITDENEMKLLKEDVLEELFAEKIAKADDAFITFMEQFTNGWNIQPAKDRVLQIYDFAESHPFPGDWLDGFRRTIAERTPESFYTEEWMQFLIAYECEIYSECIELTKEAIDICDSTDGPHQYREALTDDLRFYRALEDADCFRARNVLLAEHSFVRLSTKRNPEQSEEKREVVKSLRESAKDLLNGWQKSMYYLDSDILQQDYLACGQTLLYLLDLVKEFAERFVLKKEEKNMIDFSDMEHKALEILLRKEDGKYVPSDVAKAYRDFFEEVMVDEYQDSNAVQELLLESISRQNADYGNRFMVGDVKQSIYRFRLAKPEIFMKKYDSYSKETGVNRRIDLAENFRSRREVVDSVNAVFERLMMKQVGGITYDEDARLNYAAVYPETEMQSNRSELLFFDRKKFRESMKAGALSKCSNTEVEARMIANRIHELYGKFMVTDKETKQLRPARYSDMVILLRVATGVDEVLKKIFTEENIPTYITSRSGYFRTPEIHLLLDYLSVIDNPRQDIPLLSVLHSHIGGFSEEEIADIRIARNTEELLYDSVVGYVEDNLPETSAPISEEPQELAFRLRTFLEQMETVRTKAIYTDVYHLLEYILEMLAYENYVSLLPGGEQRRANVRLLLQKAKGFESAGYSGLFRFVRYIENMKENAMDFGEANILSDEADVVRIMTIHKSKGLEFPICFVSGLSKQFRKTDFADEILCDEELGVACNYFDRNSRCVRTTLYKNAIGIKKKLDARGEDIRILYVALTRAREKLILSGYVNDSEKEKPTLMVRQSALLKASSFMSLCAPLAFALPEVFDVREILPEEIVAEHEAGNMQKQILKEFLKSLPPQKTFVSYSYPHSSLDGLYTKTTVSELKKAAYMETAENVAELYPLQEDASYIPAFVGKKEEGGGAKRGSAYHRVMELLNFAALSETNRPDAEYTKQLEEMLSSGKLTAEEAGLVDREKLLAFLTDPLASRMGNAQQKGCLYREQPFVLGVPASVLNSDFPAEETVLVQGVIDVYFEEDGDLVLLDYKTDRVQSLQELSERYATQLEYYAQALEKTEHKKVKAKILYSFALRESIVL